MSSSLFGDSGRVNDPAPPASSLRIQSSVQGKCIAIFYGQTRGPCNIFWYGDFVATAQQQGGGGGKGGVFGGNSQGSTTYTYSAAVALGICEGPIQAILKCWQSKSESTLPSLGLSEFDGGYAQSPWTYLTSLHPTEALNYRGIAYAAAGPLMLGDQPELPNLNFEVLSTISNAIVAAPPADQLNLVTTILNTLYPGIVAPGGLLPQGYVDAPIQMLERLFSIAGYGAVTHVVTGSPDANPRDMVVDFLTNAHYGVPSWPAGLLGSLDTFANYCQAVGLVMSTALVDPLEARSTIAEWLSAANAEPVWSSGLLNIVPRGDQTITANGATYTAPAAPLFDLTDDDFLPGTSGSDTSPIQCSLKPQTDKPNSVSVEFIDRVNAYNPSIIEAKDDASIASYGLRKGDPKQWHFFNMGSAAQAAAQLLLGREQIPATYTFSLGPEYIFLDPMDIVSLTDPVLGLAQQWVRIIEIQENADHSLDFTAEEYQAGTGSAPLYGSQAGAGHIPDYNQSAGNILEPVLFEPTDELGGGLFIWAATQGPDPLVYGGCEVWVSTDGITYGRVARQTGPSRYGTLTAPLPAFTESPTPPTIDTTNTLEVDLGVSEGTLSSGSTQDAINFSTACWVDGEVLAYETATLDTGFEYDLTYLVRGIYGTEDQMVEHATGSTFVRLDNGLAKIPFNQNQIGQTIYIKFLTFNVWSGGKQELSDVSPYTYVIQGTALASPLPNIANLRAGFVGNISQILWDEIVDFRPFRYQVSKGPTFLGSQILRVVAHPPFATQGDGTYYVTAISEPVPGLIVYSETPQVIVVSGSALSENVIEIWDERATGWRGTFTGGAFTDGTVIRTGSNGDFLAITDFLGIADFLNANGTGQINGTYEIPSAHVVSITGPFACKIVVTWITTGQLVTADFLGVADFLGQTDFLGYLAAARVDVYPEIRTAQEVGTGFLARTDFLGTADFLHDGDWLWGAWQKYETAYYTGMAFDCRMILNTTDPSVIAECLDMVFSVDVPDRTDDYLTPTSASGLTPIVFRRNRGASPEAFNGGPGELVVPAIQSSIVYSGAATQGDQVVIDSLTLAGCNVGVINASAYVERNLHSLVQGF